MVKLPTASAVGAKVSVANRSANRVRREIDRAEVFKAVTKRDPRRTCGKIPDSRLSRRRAKRSPSSHLQDGEKTMSEALFVGIDVAKDSVEVASCPPELRLSAPNKASGFRQLLDALKPREIALVVLEATGGYERPLAAELAQAGFNVVVVNPRQVRDFARGLGEYAKTDPIDASVLARFAQVVHPKPRPRSSDTQGALAELVSRRRQLTGLLTAETNRLETMREKHVVASIRRVIKTLQDQIRQLDDLINEHIQSDDGLRQKDQILRSARGVGPHTSAMILGHLPEIGRLNRQEIAALVGVAPWDLRSGKYVGKARIWGGRKEVRCALYMAALSAMRCNPHIRAIAERLRKAGKCFKVIITACMRKLLITLNTLVRNNSPWQSDFQLKNA